MSGKTSTSIESHLARWTAPFRAAEHLLTTLGIDTFDDMEDLAARAGFRVEYRHLPRKVSGFRGIDDCGQCFVAVNVNSDPVHQVFTIAHEMGHHVLSHPLQLRQQDPTLELEANLFATTILTRYGGNVSIRSHEMHNPDAALLTFAPLVCKHLPEIIDFARACGDLIGWFGNLGDSLEAGALNLLRHSVSLLPRPDGGAAARTRWPSS